MEVDSLALPHGFVVLVLIGLRAHALDSFELVVGHDDCIFGSEGLCFFVCIVIGSFGANITFDFLVRFH